MIKENLQFFAQQLKSYNAKLIPVSKTKPVNEMMVAYNAGNRVFGENKVQELVDKAQAMPEDVEWHFIGHLQRNKVKYLAPFVSLIHGVDSVKLLFEINKQAIKNQRTIRCLLQIHIAAEETKFGFAAQEVIALMNQPIWSELSSISVEGLMGMATNTEDLNKVRSEFHGLRELRDTLQQQTLPDQVSFKVLSMGMTNDYKTALEEGSNMIRIGTAIFGARTTYKNV